MASGQKHDKATIFLSVPFGIFIGLIWGLNSALIAGISFCIAGLWLSPDLDIHSKSLKRWGRFQIIWRPYRKFITHRSLLSHGIFIGTTVRIGYLISMVLMLKVLLNFMGIDLEYISINRIRNLIEKYPKQFVAILIGAEGSAWLHLILDGDPRPKCKKFNS